MNTTIDHSDELLDPLFEEAARAIVSLEATNNIDFDKYPIYGDVEEIKRVVSTYGIVNIGIQEVINTLSVTNSNYITTGKGKGAQRILMALKQAVERLPVAIDDIDKMIVSVWTGISQPVEMQEIKAMIDWLEECCPAINLIWGIAKDKERSLTEIKIALLAVNRHRLC